MFLVANLPNIGLAPAVRLQGPIAQRLAEYLSIVFNDGLEATLDALEVTFPITIKRLDVFAVLNGLVDDPEPFGLTNVEDSCITPNVLRGAVCSHPDQYLFWDGIHPRTAAHEWLAIEAHEALMGP